MTTLAPAPETQSLHATLSDYIESTRSTAETNWLGLLTMFSVNETTIPHTQLRDYLTKAGLTDYIPGSPADSDTFRRVMINGQRVGGLATDDPDVVENLLLRPIPTESRSGRILRRVVIEKVDRNEGPLDHHESVEISFDDSKSLDWKASSGEPRPTPIVRSTNLNGNHEESLALAQRLVADYHAKRGMVDADAIRRFIKRVLTDSRSTMIREGVYFSGPSHVGKIAALESVIGHIPGANVKVIPLIDTDKQRTLVREAFEAEVTADVDRLLDEIAHITRTNASEGTTISKAKAAAIVNQHRLLVDKLDEYQDLLENNIDNAAFRTTLLKSKLAGVLDCVK